MKTRNSISAVLLAALLFIGFSCQKEGDNKQMQTEGTNQLTEGTETVTPKPTVPPFNLEAILRGNEEQSGFIKFRQDSGAAKIVTLDTRVRNLEPNHEYLLQRAVDVFDGICTSTTWLTLGKGLTPQSILTNDEGNGREILWRNVSAIPSGTKFDIHFRLVDAAGMTLVLNSDCYAYMVK